MSQLNNKQAKPQFLSAKYSANIGQTTIDLYNFSILTQTKAKMTRFSCNKS